MSDFAEEPRTVKGKINNLAKDAIQVCQFSGDKKAALGAAIVALNEIAHLSQPLRFKKKHNS